MPKHEKTLVIEYDRPRGEERTTNVAAADAGNLSITSKPRERVSVEIYQAGPESWNLAIRGEVDADNCDVVHAALIEAEPDAPELTVDLSELTFFDSSGISTFLQIKNELDGAGRTLRLQSPTDSVRRVLEITGLLELFGLADG
ncbi:MAG: STAS domain-containing protein [Acidimicrobiia bacterium]|nr:STAS domain-containing protein [Acidimicrobiia bacterium]